MTRLERIRQMLDDNPHDPFLLYGLAMEQQSKEDWDSALASFDRVLEVDPNYVAAYFQKGQLLARLYRADEARAVLGAGIAVGREVGDDHAVAEMSEFLQTL
jgi:tetratricopeptide (TPR) repeat protein